MSVQQNLTFLNKQLVLFPTQYGFRANYSTIHAILDITSTCHDNIENKLFTGLVLLNFATAFDAVDHCRVLVKQCFKFFMKNIDPNLFPSTIQNPPQIA